MLIESYTNQGKRTEQEDFFYYNEGIGLYIVCDGVGGAAKGDVASKLTAETIKDLVESKSILPTNKLEVDKLLKKVQAAFISYINTDPSAEGMNTTLAMVYFHNEGVTVTHVGDSRIYYLKENGVVWQSKDHSVVQDLRGLGLLKTTAEMEKHPLKNWITRSINSQDKIDADVTNFDMLATGDVLLICTDGVLEPFPNGSILPILENRILPLGLRMSQIKMKCMNHSNDNNTAILLELEDKDTLVL